MSLYFPQNFKRMISSLHSSEFQVLGNIHQHDGQGHYT